MKKNSTHWYLNFYNWFLIILGLIIVLPFLAPIFLHFNLDLPAKFIYFIYSFTCHQFHHRSLHLFDHQCAWCARDTGIWMAIFFVALLVKFDKLKSIRWYWVIPFIVPMALDGGVQTIFTMLNVEPFGTNSGAPLYISNNFVRFLTGSLFGLGISWWISPTLKTVDLTNEKSLSRPTLKILSVCMACFLFFYFILVGFWSITSKSYRPSDILDSAVKTPSEDFFARRVNAVCPTTSEDLFAFDCFFN
jgi:uncharacterized membrane protein